MRYPKTSMPTIGLLVMLLSLTGFTAFGATADLTLGMPALAGLDIAEIDCANLITADAIGREQFERYGLADKLEKGSFEAHEFAGYVVCSTESSLPLGDISWQFATTYFIFDRRSGQLVVTSVDQEGALPASRPTPESMQGSMESVFNDAQTTTVCMAATTPLLEIGDESPEQFDLWGILDGVGCGKEILGGAICLNCGEQVVWRWLVPAPSGQEADTSTGVEGRGGRTCFDAEMAVQITGQELDKDDARRIASGNCGMRLGGDQACWFCMEERPEPTATLVPSPTERPRKDPVCSDYLTPEVVGQDAWEKYGIAEKLRANEVQRVLGLASDSIICYGHRRIDGAVVHGDELYYKFDIESGKLLTERIHWREDLPEHLPPLRISQEEAEAMVEGEVGGSYLAILSPDQMLFGTDFIVSFREPCWMVSSTGRQGDFDIAWVTVINAITGEVLGRYCPC